MYRLLPRLLPFILLTIAPLSRADIDVRVGGAGCTFSTIQAAIDNANPANGITNILIARNQTYTAQQINISSKNVRLIGGYADCAQTVRDSVQTVISGAGGSARSVINVTGSTGVVAFYNLLIQDGDESQTVVIGDTDVYGGAVDISGGPHQLVYFEGTQLRGNIAGAGGAVSIRGNPSDLTDTFVWMSANTIVNENTSRTLGGGVYCSDATFHFKGPGATILNNTTGTSTVDGLGGGLFANNCKIRIASSGRFLANAISTNNASDNGGGIYAIGALTELDIYNINPDQPTRISGNSAGRFGGGMDIEDGAIVRAWDVIIEQNIAKQGGGGVALYEGMIGQYAEFWLIQNLATPGLGFSAPNGNSGTYDLAVQCSQSWNCAVLQDNIARSDANVPQPGSAFRISSDNTLAAVYLYGARITRNEGESAVKLKSPNGGSSKFIANGSVIDGNINTTVLLDGETSSFVQALHTTITNNTIPATQVLNSDLSCVGADGIGVDRFLFRNSIVLQPGKRITSSMPETGCLRYVIGSVFENIPIADESTFRNVDPRFNNAALGDFTLKPNSPALDFAPSIGGISVTRDGRPRSVDLAFNSNDFGATDLGAYEMAATDFPQIDITVSNSDVNGTVTPGATRLYSYAVINNGPSNSASTKITSTHSANFSACSWTCSNFGSAAFCPAASGAGSINHDINMPSGSLLLYNVSCGVSVNATGSVTSTFFAESNSAADTNFSDNTRTITDSVIQATDLRLTMTDGVSAVTAGGTVNYTITATNLGSVNSGNVVVTDAFPSGLTCTWTCTGNISGTCSANGTGNIADIANLPAPTGAPFFLPAGEVVYQVNCQVAANATGTLVNTASVTPNASVSDPNLANNSVTDTNSVVALTTNMIINLDNSQTIISPGSTVLYRSGVTNNSNTTAAIGATVQMNFPSNLNCTWTCQTDGPGAACSAMSGTGNISQSVNLPIGTSVAAVLFDATCQVSNSATGVITVVASVTPPAGIVETFPSNNTAMDSDSVMESADIAVSVFNGGFSSVTAGGTILYGVTIANNGPSSVNSFQYQIVAPLECQSFAWTCSSGGGATCAASSGSGSIGGASGAPFSAGFFSGLVFNITCGLNPAITEGNVVLNANLSNSNLPDHVSANNSVSDTLLIVGDVVFRNSFENP